MDIPNKDRWINNPSMGNPHTIRASCFYIFYINYPLDDISDKELFYIVNKDVSKWESILETFSYRI